jgi:hypothetical protein
MRPFRVPALQADHLMPLGEIRHPPGLRLELRLDPARLPVDCLDVFHATLSSSSRGILGHQIMEPNTRG